MSLHIQMPSLSAVQREAVDWIISNLKGSHLCDSYILMEYAPSNPLHATGEWQRAWWLRQYGFSREDDFQGIAVIQLQTVAP
jgi:hypothetical protein